MSLRVCVKTLLHFFFAPLRLCVKFSYSRKSNCLPADVINSRHVIWGARWLHKHLNLIRRRSLITKSKAGKPIMIGHGSNYCGWSWHWHRNSFTSPSLYHYRLARAIFGLALDQAKESGELRVEANNVLDTITGHTSPNPAADWLRCEELLRQCYSSLHRATRK